LRQSLIRVSTLLERTHVITRRTSRSAKAIVLIETTQWSARQMPINLLYPKTGDKQRMLHSIITVLIREIMLFQLSYDYYYNPIFREKICYVVLVKRSVKRSEAGVCSSVYSRDCWIMSGSTVGNNDRYVDTGLSYMTRRRQGNQERFDLISQAICRARVEKRVKGFHLLHKGFSLCRVSVIRKADSFEVQG
ncbi:hypothetical protein KCU89_g157, partial [Aureobasidium melanogenum]